MSLAAAPTDAPSTHDAAPTRKTLPAGVETLPDVAELAGARAHARELAALRLVAPRRFEARVRKAMAASEGHIPIAALRLGVAPRTLFGWLDAPVFASLKRAPVGRPPRRSRSSARV